MAENVELRKQKTIAKFPIAVSTEYNVAFKTIVEKLRRNFYYPTVLGIVQKARETSTNIPRYWTVSYCTVGYCTVQQCARSSCYTCSFLSSYWKSLEKVKLDNKSLIRCFGVKYRRIFSLIIFILTLPAGSSKYSTTRKKYTAILQTETSYRIYVSQCHCSF